MSQASIHPSEVPRTVQNTASARADTRRDEMLRDGVSQSGYERNCCFLNTGAARFANISAAAGLDHIGDGRAYALVDWDHDGDFDLWATNRNGPRVQFLRNNSGSDHHFLALKLEGNGITTNRDAIGARVELVLKEFRVESSELREEGEDSQLSTLNSRPLIKSLRAGEGFLGQSSKWIHFGLGRDDQIDRLIVHWPGGEAQQYTNLEADRHYVIVQGSDRAEIWSRPIAPVALEASENKPPPPTDLARILLNYPIPMPKIDYETFQGKQVSLNEHHGSPTLVSFWASWCQPCLVELAEFRDHADDLQRAELAIIALSVDGLSEDIEADPGAVQKLVERLELPFAGGVATEALIEKFEIVLYQLYGHRRRWAVPSSFLLDAEGRLAAIYIGRVDIEELISDVHRLQTNEQAWLEASLPFSGRWVDKRRLPDMWPLVSSLFKEKYTSEAIDYFSRLIKLQAPTETFPKLLVQVGVILRNQGDLTTAADRLQEGLEIDSEITDARLLLSHILYSLDRVEDAVHHCREVLKRQPDHVAAHVGMGSMLQTKGELDEAISHLQRAIELKPNHAKAHYSLGMIHGSQQRWDQAIEHLRQAVESNPDLPDAHRELGRALLKTDRQAEAIEQFELAVQLNPEDVDALYTLGAALASAGREREAIQSFRKAHREDADSLRILNGLAWLLATSPDATSDDGAEAVLLAKKSALKTQQKHPQILDTLAAAYAAVGQFDEAVKIARRAIAQAKAAQKDELAEEIQGRLDLYSRRQPYRESGKPH